jgi:hypothetical protein
VSIDVEVEKQQQSKTVESTPISNKKKRECAAFVDGDDVVDVVGVARRVPNANYDLSPTSSEDDLFSLGKSATQIVSIQLLFIIIF